MSSEAVTKHTDDAAPKDIWDLAALTFHLDKE